MKDSVESKLGLFFAVAVIAALIVLEFAGSFSLFKRGYHLHAQFKNVQELKVGDEIKLAGVQIGRVQSIKLTNNGLADVEMNLVKDTDIKSDSKAALRFTGLMAQDFIAIQPGISSTRAEEGAVLESIEQPDLGSIMGKLDNVATGVENITKSFSGEKIDNLLGPITDLVKNNQSNFSATVGNLRTISQRIVEGQGTVGKLINQDTLYVSALNTVSNLQDSTTNIKDLADQAHTLITNANQTVTGINAGQGTVGKLIKDDKLYVEASAFMTNMHSISDKINNGQGTVGQLINDDSTLKNIKLSMQKLDKATESLEDTGPLSVLGTMASSLF